MFGDLYGPDVNLAARLVGARPNRRRRWCPMRLRSEGSGFRFERLPPLTLKGFAEPATAYRLERRRR